MLLHQVIITGGAACVLFAKNSDTLLLLLLMLCIIYGMFIMNGGCVLSSAERKFYKVDIADLTGRMLVPGYRSELHRMTIGVGKILAGIYVCIAKIAAIWLTSLFLLCFDWFIRYPKGVGL